MSTLTHRRRLSIRPRRSGSRIARAVLLISFMILLGRFAYSTITAFDHHQNKQQQAEQLLLPTNVLVSQKE
ncbi:YfgG family protein [Pectobacterium sp. A5351]|uniref:YfgG family protein n=1 Tax=Pectobacterium sp. A5351 TaxID=2914983 RepID=UPI0023307ADE|nr:YfgG family protein [Pectobacterium sp. A5351]WCG84206.1 YfgG family protein [Pectobacterium sp. A5351]